MSSTRKTGPPAERRRSRKFRRAPAGRAAGTPDLAQLFVDRADEYIAWIDSSGRLIHGNPAICRALGYSLSEFSSLHAWDIFPSPPETWPNQFKESKDRLLILDLRTRSGSILAASIEASHVACGGKEYLICRGHDSLSGRLLESHDEDRRLLARELHDTTGQNLGALSISLSMAALDPGAIQESIALAGSCLRGVRQISYRLHPPLLDELGLLSALRAYAGRYSKTTGIQLDLDLPPQMPRLSQPFEIALFRIAEEALRNIHRHSGSSQAILRLQHDAHRIQLEIIDHGRGLPPGTGGLGIAAMRERARRLGGHLTIESGETGTTLRLILPAATSVTA